MKLGKEELEVILLTLKVATVSTLFIIPISIFLARLLSRQKLKARMFIEVLVSMPLVLPPVATGYLLLLLLGTQGPVGMWLNKFFGIRVTFSYLGAVVASVVVSLPIAVRAIRVNMERIDPTLEYVAATLGVPNWRRFLFITLPLCWPGIVSGAVLAFIRSVGEFGATITLAGSISGQSKTLSVALWSALQDPGREAYGHTLLIFAFVLGFIALLGSELVVRRFSS